jgi:hypothetical protein
VKVVEATPPDGVRTVVLITKSSTGTFAWGPLAFEPGVSFPFDGSKTERFYFEGWKFAPPAVAPGPLAPRKACEPGLPRPDWVFEPEDSGQVVTASSAALDFHATWLDAGCAPSSTIAIEVIDRELSCALHSRHACCLSIDCDNASIEGSYDPSNGALSLPGCMLSGAGGAPDLGETPAQQLDCNSGAPFSTAELWSGGERTFAELKTLEVAAGQPLGAGPSAGILSDLVVFEGNRVAVSVRPTFFGARCEDAQGIGKLVVFGGEALTPIATATAPPCLERLQAGEGEGFYGVFGAPSALTLGRFDRLGRLAASWPLATITATLAIGGSSYPVIDLALMRMRWPSTPDVPSSTLVILLTNDSRSQVLILKEPLGDPPPQALESKAFDIPGGADARILVATTTCAATVIDRPSGDTGFRANILGICGFVRGTNGPAPIYPPAPLDPAPTGLPLLPAHASYDPYAHRLVISDDGKSPALHTIGAMPPVPCCSDLGRRRFFERPGASPLASVTWTAPVHCASPGDCPMTTLMAVAEARSRTGSVAPQLWLAEYDADALRFVYGAMRLSSSGVITRARAAEAAHTDVGSSPARVWMMLPWSGELLRVTPSLP